MEGWIKLHRQLLEWEWYDDHNTFRLFIYMLLKANHKDGKWRGNEISKGSFISSISNLATETGLSNKQIRTSLNKLKKTNEVASKGHSKFTVFHIVKYDEYQQEGKQEGTERANKGQTKGKQRATNKNDNNDKNVKNNKIESIDSTKLLKFFNDTFNKKHEVFSDANIRKFNNLLKKGYKKEHIMRAMINVSKSKWHQENFNHKITIKYFTDPNHIDEYGYEIQEKKLTYNPHL